MNQYYSLETLDDFIDADLPNEHLEENNDGNCFDIYEIAKPRHSMDAVVNNYGNNLIELCICQELLIVNGRVRNDKGKGKLTCKNTSLVDYVIASPCIFPNLTYFDIEDFDHLLSDVHCAIYTILKIEQLEEVEIEEQENNRTTFTKPIWKNELKQQYLQNISDLDIQTANIYIDNLVTNTDNISQDNIDKATKDIVSIMYDAANKSGLIRTIVNNKNGQKQNIVIN